MLNPAIQFNIKLHNFFSAYLYLRQKVIPIQDHRSFFIRRIGP